MWLYVLPQLACWEKGLSMGSLLEAPAAPQPATGLEPPTSLEERVTSVLYSEARSLLHRFDPEKDPYIDWEDVHRMLSRMTEAAAGGKAGDWQAALTAFTGVRP